MTRSRTAQAVSIALSMLVTLCTLMALDGLASAQQATPQQVAAIAASRA